MVSMTHSDCPLDNLRRLNMGFMPHDLGMKKIGEGWYKSAYQLDGWVYKRAGVEPAEADIPYPSLLMEANVSQAFTVRLGDWQAQEAVHVLRDIDVNHPAWDVYVTNRLALIADVHDSNVGVDEFNNLVCFDW